MLGRSAFGAVGRWYGSSTCGRGGIGNEKRWHPKRGRRRDMGNGCDRCWDNRSSGQPRWQLATITRRQPWKPSSST